MIDEAHELKKLSLVILAILRNLLQKEGSKIKLIVTSATLDSKLFEEYFADMKYQLIEAVTPTFDVETHYTNFPDLDTTLVENTAAHLKVIFDHIRRNFCDPQSQTSISPNVLVFLPSVKDIKEVLAYIENDEGEVFKKIRDSVNFCLEELHGALLPEEKNKVIRPRVKHKDLVRVILATKIAETAITLDEIYYVLDSGLEREYYFDEVSKMHFIQETRISKSSAEQRKGRAGRVGDGFCFKMYKEEEEVKFRDNKVPEILRMDLSDVILLQTELSHLFNFGDLMYFHDLEISKINSITDELKRIDAIQTANSKSTLTSKGKVMLKMGCSALVAAFLVECYSMGCLDYGVIAAASMENVKNLFRDSEKINSFSMTSNMEQYKTSQNLGDLGVIINVCRTYENMKEHEQKVFHSDFDISKKDIDDFRVKAEHLKW